ncbi:Secondary metabolism regulator [Lachnellula subtilissima]|uniref:Secondary metabolism regulator n=1 Tax=Lachnellula subtilissima TaxID=602034 RepID=A0A8H8RGT4_9HELO|nr:Secondary metabolism regulator [Lachnellula subtilissima]
MAELSGHQPPQEADAESIPQVEEAHSPQEMVPEAVQTAESGNSPQTGLPAEPTDPSSHPQNQAPLQIDEDNSSADSAYGSSVASSSDSLGSSITNYLYENGRRYHAYKEGEYYLPNDEIEQARLDLQHHIYRLCLGGNLYCAPIKDPQSVLDIGTGTGIWAIEFADEFPGAVVIGTDLSPIQPNFVPPNVKFYVDDFEQPWDYQEVGKLDFIHWRSLSGSTGNWSKLYGQAFNNLKPGAFLEVHEYDANVYSDEDPNFEKAPWTRSWCDTLDVSSTAFGKTLNVGRFHKQWMEEAGFVDIEEKVVKCPIGPWTKDPQLKELGRFERWHMNESVEAHSMALYTRVLNHSVDEAKIAFEMVRKEFNDRKLFLYTVYRFIYGRRPEA